MSNFEKLVFIQLSNFYIDLKPFCPIKDIFHVFAPKELVHTFWTSDPIYQGSSTHTHTQCFNFLIQPRLLYPQIQQIVAYFYLFLCCNPYHFYQHISKISSHINHCNRASKAYVNPYQN